MNHYLINVLKSAMTNWS